MKRFSYGERDYAFGQAMLTLRITIGLTQAGLAERLRVSRKAISRWEAGGSYPKAEHLKALLAFAVGQQAFPAGREEEEVRATSASRGRWVPSVPDLRWWRCGQSSRPMA